MARPREFDLEDLLEKAMLAFWESGLQRTSMRRLEAATGVKQVSLYNVFGDKEGLFLAVLGRYNDLLTTVLDRHLDNRGLDGIASFTTSIVTPESGFPNNCFGCLIVNTALAVEVDGPAVKMRVDACRAMVRARLAGALERAKSRDTLRRGLNVDECAELVISTLWGIFVTIRLAGEQTAGKPAAEALNQTLSSWRVQSD